MRITASSLKEYQEIEDKIKLLGDRIQNDISHAERGVIGGVSVYLNDVYESKKYFLSKNLLISYIQLGKEYLVYEFQNGVSLYIKNDGIEKLVYFNI